MPAPSRKAHGHMSIYARKEPMVVASKPAGEWQTAQITIVGNCVSATLNGQKIHDNSRIPGITGGALDAKESEPGPIMIQGDHEKVWYRKVTLTPITAAGKSARNLLHRLVDVAPRPVHAAERTMVRQAVPWVERGLLALLHRHGAANRLAGNADARHRHERRRLLVPLHRRVLDRHPLGIGLELDEKIETGIRLREVGTHRVEQVTVTRDDGDGLVRSEHGRAEYFTARPGPKRYGVVLQ